MPFAKTGGLADVAGALAPRVRAARRRRAAVHAAVRAACGGLVGVRAGAGGAARARSRWARPATSSRCSAARPGHRSWRPCSSTARRCSTGRRCTRTMPDEHRRFLVFTRAVLESCQRLRFAPDIFHCNDWHTALLPLLLTHRVRVGPPVRRSRTVLTIHNIGYQGIMPASAVADLALGQGESLLDPVDLAAGQINPLNNGMTFADAVTTVSPTYAREICRRAARHGHGGGARARADGVTGILNGVDYREWDPRARPAPDRALRAAATSPASPPTSARRWPRMACPLRRLRRWSACQPAAGQKGFDLLFDALPSLLARARLRARSCWAAARRATSSSSPTSRAATPSRVGFRSRLRRGARAPDRGGQRHVPDAVALRALRPEPDVQPALRDDTGRAQYRRPGRLRAALRPGERPGYRLRVQRLRRARRSTGR